MQKRPKRFQSRAPVPKAAVDLTTVQKPVRTSNQTPVQAVAHSISPERRVRPVHAVVVRPQSVGQAYEKQEDRCSRLSIIVAAELLRPEPLVRLAAALGKAHTHSAPVLGDEYNPGSLQRQSQSSHLRSHDRDRPIRSFSLGDCGQGDLTALSQLVITPAHQGSRGTKLAPGDEAEII